MTNTLRLVPVVVGIIKRDDLFLVAKRPAHVVVPHYWEFPGGKIEANETQFEALRREFSEEIGIDLKTGHFLKQFHYAFEDRQVELNAWQVAEYHGEPYGNEGQEIRWITVKAFTDYDFLPSNAELLNYLIASHG